MDHPLQHLTKTRATRRLLRAGTESAAPVEAEYWITGPEADPLRSTPWLTKPLPRPRYGAPSTLARRLRSILVLLCVLALVAGVVALAFQVDHVLFGTPLPTLPHLSLP